MEQGLLPPTKTPLKVNEIEETYPPLGEKVRKFIELDKRKNEIKKFFDEYEQAVREIKEEVKIGFHFQDEDGTVYQMDEMQWKNVRVTPHEIKRTRREGERQGSLSLTTARDLGYEVEGKVNETKS